MRVVCTLLLFISCQGIVLAQPSSDKKYFEGVVEFEIKSESYMQGVSDNEIRERSGSNLKFYFKDGDYIREYVDGAGYTLRKILYKKDKNMVYMYDPIASPDTLYFSSAKDTNYKSFSIHQGPKEKILGYECSSSLISAKYMAPNLPDTATISFTYFFCSELPVNPEWHKDIYIWSEVIKIHKSIAIKFIEDDPYFMKQTFTATKITWQPVDDTIFKINPKLILKEMFQL